jgi:hypothetical protein
MLDLNLVRTRLPDHILNPDPEIYRSKNYVTIDFETTIIGKGLPLYPDNRIVLAAWELGADHPRVSRVQKGRSSEERGHRMFHRFDGEFGHNQLVRDIEAADFIIAHNAKFELGWLARCGLDLTKVIVWDTMLAEYVIGGNRWQWTKVSLQSCAKRHFGEDEGKVDVISALIKAGVCCSEIPQYFNNQLLGISEQHTPWRIRGCFQWYIPDAYCPRCWRTSSRTGCIWTRRL